MTAPKPLRGVIAPTLTPFNDDMSIAKDLYIAHAKRCLADGCVGLAPFGTTSEALSVGMDERMDMLEGLVASGVPASKLVVPISGSFQAISPSAAAVYGASILYCTSVSGSSVRKP